MAVTVREVREKLHPDTASIRNGIVTVRWEFFYTHGMTAERKAERVKTAFPTAVILEADEIWKPFRGNASTAASSHWVVRFRVGGA